MVKYLFTKLKDNLFDIHQDISNKAKFIDEHNLLFIDTYKIYKLNNIEIISNKDKIEFYEITDEVITINNNLLDYKFNRKSISPFNFFDCDDEEIYELYGSNNMNMKVYDNYILLEFL